MPEMNRLEMLTQMVKENPADAFSRYGLAMEYANSGDAEEALGHFSALLAAHPDYSAGYFMAAQTLAKIGRIEEAKTYLRNGIGAAARTGNAHAKSEMQSMLAELGPGLDAGPATLTGGGQT